jgi:hypothetical protein
MLCLADEKMSSLYCGDALGNCKNEALSLIKAKALLISL